MTKVSDHHRRLAEVERQRDEARGALKPFATEARETVAQWMIAHSFATGHGDTLDDLLKELSVQVGELRSQLSSARAKERERCIRIAKRRIGLDRDCESLGVMDWETGVRECSRENSDGFCICAERIEEAEEIAKAIRAEGEPL